MTLKELMKKLNLNKTELAVELGLTEQAIITWLNGRRTPNIGNLRDLYDLCQKNNIDVDLIKMFK